MIFALVLLFSSPMMTSADKPRLLRTVDNFIKNDNIQRSLFEADVFSAHNEYGNYFDMSLSMSMSFSMSMPYTPSLPFLSSDVPTRSPPFMSDPPSQYDGDSSDTPTTMQLAIETTGSPVYESSSVPTNSTESFNREIPSKLRSIPSEARGASRAAVIAALVIGVIAIILVVAAYIARQMYLSKFLNATNDNDSIAKSTKSDHTSSEETVTTK